LYALRFCNLADITSITATTTFFSDIASDINYNARYAKVFVVITVASNLKG
jgi:hypothetical protein